MNKMLIILLFSPVISFSQMRIDLGKVKGDSVCDFKDAAFADICKSENQLDIFLLIRSMLLEVEAVNLSFDGQKWKAVKYEGPWYNAKKDSFTLIPTVSFDSVFSALKANNIFLLPDQHDLKNVKGEVLDGAWYVIAFKAGNKFRHYSTDNPDVYLEYKENKHIPEFYNYVKIIEILTTWLKK